jgi:hypothetical protein
MKDGGLIDFPDYHYSSASPFSLREKVAEGRMRGNGGSKYQLLPLTLALSLMERGLIYSIAED